MTIDYLKRHGLGRDAVRAYQIGFVARPAPDDQQFAGMLAIPYQTKSGIVAIKYRCVQDHDCHDLHHPKYAQQSGQRTRVYNPAAYFNANGVIGICEGEIDAIAATEMVRVPSIGFPGADIWAHNRKIWKLTLQDYDKIVIFADGDEAGLKMAKMIADDLGKRVRLARCDPGEDVSSMVAAHRGAELRAKAGL